MVAHVESDPDKDTIQQPIHSIHKDEIGVRIPGAPPNLCPCSPIGSRQRP
jgi:hypothetical protein